MNFDSFADPELVSQLEFQLSEAKTYARRGETSAVRIGIILIDNAAELLMNANIDGCLFGNDHLGQLLYSYAEAKSRLGNVPPDPDLEEFLAEYVPAKRVKRIERVFGEKVDFLVERGILSAHEGRIFKKFHEYRNSAYHGNSMQEDILEHICLVYFSLVVEVLGRGLKAPIRIVLLPGEARHEREVADDLLLDVLLDHDGIRRLLASHLRSRLEATMNQLGRAASFVAWLPAEAILAFSQVYKSEVPKTESALLSLLKSATYSWNDMERWSTVADQIEGESEMNFTYALVLFADTEDEYALLEQIVARLADEVEREIQDQIDFARGK